MINRRGFLALFGSLPVIGTLVKAETPPSLLNIPDVRVDVPPKSPAPVGYFHHWDDERDYCLKCHLTRYECVENDIFHCRYPSPAQAFSDDAAPPYQFNNDPDTGLYVASDGEVKVAIGGRTC